MTSGELTITNISASGLGQGSPGEDLTKTNPYVLFEIGSESHKTKKEKKVSSEVSWDDDTVTLKHTSGDVLSVSGRGRWQHLCAGGYKVDHSDSSCG